MIEKTIKLIKNFLILFKKKKFILLKLLKKRMNGFILMETILAILLIFALLPVISNVLTKKNQPISHTSTSLIPEEDDIIAFFLSTQSHFIKNIYVQKTQSKSFVYKKISYKVIMTKFSNNNQQIKIEFFKKEEKIFERVIFINKDLQNKDFYLLDN